MAGISTLPTAMPRPINKVPANKALTLPAERKAMPSNSSTSAAAMVRCTPKRRASVGAKGERNAKPSKGRVVIEPARVLLMPRPSRIKGMSAPTDVSGARKVAPTRITPISNSPAVCCCVVRAFTKTSCAEGAHGNTSKLSSGYCLAVAAQQLTLAAVMDLLQCVFSRCSDDKVDMKETILVTGGAGYIGAHTCVQLLAAGYALVVLDNLSNGSAEALRRVQTLSGQTLTFVEGDIRCTNTLTRVFSEHSISAVVHFAGLKAVGESVAEPLRYYDNNVVGTLRLLETMQQHGCRRLVFSSSATVYGDPASVPIGEGFPLSATNPYGRSKLMVEDMLRDLHTADGRWA